eukprot:XP_001710110.1 Hypothetical protein GL50803_28288 [Giardia lamblia ATCC 50803]
MKKYGIALFNRGHLLLKKLCVVIEQLEHSLHVDGLLLQRILMSEDCATRMARPSLYT